MKEQIYKLVRENAMNNSVYTISQDDLKKIVESTELNLRKELSGYGVVDKPYNQYYTEGMINSDFPHERVSKVFLEQCLKYPSHKYLIADKTSMSFKDFYDSVLLCADSLKKIGLKKGDIITMGALSVPNALVMFFAINLLGGVVRTIDPISSPELVKKTLINTGSKYYITMGINYPKQKDIINDTNVQKVVYLDLNKCMYGVPKVKKNIINIMEKGCHLLLNKDKNKWIPYKKLMALGSNDKTVFDLAEKYVPNEICAIFSTSGSTGEPKGVCITNENFLSSVYKQFLSDFDVDGNDTVFNPMPLNSSYFWCDAMGVCLWGATIKLSPLFNPDDSPKQIVDSQTSLVLLGPIILERMLEYFDECDEKHKKIDLNHVRFFISGGDILSLDLEKKFNDRVKKYNTNAVVNNALGTSETIGPAFNPNGILKNKGTYQEGSVGVVLPGDDVGIFAYDEDNEFRNIDSLNYDKGLLYYEIGEICFNVNNPTVFKEYYNNEKATSDTKLIHSDGSIWYHTGDLGYMDPAGHMFCSGRKTGLIVRSGHKVWAKKIENVLMNIEGISDCAIVGVPDKNEQEIPACFIVFEPEIDDNSKKAILNNIPTILTKELDEMHVPKFYHEMSILPRNTMMKIKIKDLFDIYLEQKNIDELTNKESKKLVFRKK